MMEEIIELNLNKPWPSMRTGYSNHMEEVRTLVTRRPRRTSKCFIEII